MVQQTFDDCCPRKLNRIWLSCLQNLNEILKHDGDNKHKTPHMNKQRLERENRLPITPEAWEADTAIDGAAAHHV